MLILLAMLWFMVYIWSICASFFQLQEIKGAIKVLGKYLNSATVEISAYWIVESQLLKNEDYQECLSNALAKFPIISKYCEYDCDPLRYGVSDAENYAAAVNLYNDLAMRTNYLFESFKLSLNPFNAIKKLYSLPSLALSWLGLPSKLSFSRMFNLMCWILAYILELYGNEIKSLLSSLF